MSPGAAKRLPDMPGNLKVHVMLALGYGCGLRAARGEIVRPRAGDIDSAQMIIRIVQASSAGIGSLLGRRTKFLLLPEFAASPKSSGS
jgi:hypothetical protein